MQLPSFAEIRLIIFDFDKTIINLHTHGSFPKDRIEFLRTCTSPFFIKIVPILIERGFNVAITSFSDKKHLKPCDRKNHFCGPELITQFLKLHFNNNIVKDIHIESFDPGFQYRSHFKNAIPEDYYSVIINKNIHIINLKHKLDITRDEQILFIDDTMKNIKYLYGNVKGFCIPKGIKYLTEDYWDDIVSTLKERDDILSIVITADHLNNKKKKKKNKEKENKANVKGPPPPELNAKPSKRKKNNKNTTALPDYLRESRRISPEDKFTIVQRKKKKK